MRRIVLHIDCLTLRGFARSRAAAVSAGLRAELQSLLAADPAVDAMLAHQSARVLQAGEVRVTQGEDSSSSRTRYRRPNRARAQAMSERSPANAAKIGSGSAFAMLQRKCACGGKASQVSGDCSDCQRKKTLGIQKKVAVGTTDDPLEHEADRAAERVLSMPASAAAPHAHALTPVHSYPPSESAPAPVAQAASPAALAASGQPAATTGEPQSQAPSEAELDHGGSPLEPGLRGFFEQRYERDLSEVRIHVGGQAESWNDRLTAHAFTYGSHIWLGRGQRPRADFLLAHELAHVIQQRQPQVLRSPKLNEDIDGKPSLSEVRPHRAATASRHTVLGTARRGE